jgi:hypothetical protein
MRKHVVETDEAGYQQLVYAWNAGMSHVECRVAR